MIKINSIRAQKILSGPRFVKNELSLLMKKYPGSGFNLWASLEWDQHIVKNLSFFGDFPPHIKIILESMASLLIGKPITGLDNLTVRECEAFLRDRNSEVAIEGMTEEDENYLKKVFHWLRAWPLNEGPKEYHFHSGKGPFKNLKLVEKIKELKAFLNSPEILTLYQNMARPELVDVEDLTVYIHAPYTSQREKGLFEELHIMGVEAFQEENLNFIPDV